MTSASPENSEWRFPNRATPLGSPHYYAVRFCPAAQRERNARLLAWYQLIQGIAERPPDPGVARLKLDWWRAEIDSLRSGDVRHPLAIELHRDGISESAVTVMQAIIASTEAEILTPRIVDDAHFVRVCRNSLGSFFELLANIDIGGQGDREHCRQAGAYCAAVERLRSAARSPHKVPFDLRPGRLDQLPIERRMARCDDLLDRMRHDTDRSAQRLPDLARRLTALAEAMHRKIRRKGYPVADTLIDRAPIAHLWTAWRCS